MVDKYNQFSYNSNSSKSSNLNQLNRQLRKASKMTTSNLFTVAGTSNRQGEVKVRFANDLVSRIKALHRAGHTDINLVELPQPMSKLEALQYLQAQGITQGDAGYAVASKVAEKSKLAKKGEVKVKATSVKATVKADTKVTA